MTNRYALINSATGAVENMILWDGGEGWFAPAGYEAVQSNTAGIGWVYAAGVFSEPPPPPVAPPSAAEVLATNTSILASLQATAAIAIAPLNLSLQLGNATQEEMAQASAWQTYSRSLVAIDLTQTAPAWPQVPA